MSNLGSLYIEMGEPEGELDGCPCEVGDWAADEIVRQHNRIKKLEAALLNISRTADIIEVDQTKDREKKNKDTLDKVIEASKKLLEEIDRYHHQYPGMAKGYVLDAMEEMKKAIKETYK